MIYWRWKYPLCVFILTYLNFLRQKCSRKHLVFSDISLTTIWYTVHDMLKVEISTVCIHTWTKVKKGMYNNYSSVSLLQARNSIAVIKTVARQVLCITSWIYKCARNLYRERRAVSLPTFTNRHSNHKLSIVMALSTTFTQCTPETTKFGKITQNKGHFAIFAV